MNVTKLHAYIQIFIKVYFYFQDIAFKTNAIDKKDFQKRFHTLQKVNIVFPNSTGGSSG